MPTPRIPLLDATALTGLVQLIPTGPSLVLTNKITKVRQATPTVQWDVIRGQHNAAKFNSPGGEANIVDQAGRTTQAFALGYIREKKIFDPVTLYWIREAGGLGLQNAQAAVAREVSQLNERIDNRVELTLWQALSGTAVLPRYDGSSTTVDYLFRSTHKYANVAAAVSAGYHNWSTASYTDIIKDIRKAKRLIEVDGRVPVTEAFISEATMDYVFDAAVKPVTTSTPDLVTVPGGNMLSDRMKEMYYNTGTLPGFMGMNWTVIPASNLYDDDSGNPAQLVSDNAVYFTNLSAGSPIELAEGPTADLSNTQGSIGKFSKSWKEEDPSAEQFLIEYAVLPKIIRPDQFLYLPVA